MNKIVEIPISQIWLSTNNPRFEAVNTEDEAIAYLCENEYIFELAKDIVENNSLNPLELLAVTRKDGFTDVYVALEGNRRICALKLLKDPERSPDKLKEKFKAVAEGFAGNYSLPSIIFDSAQDAKVWLERLHGGQLNGVGRRKWNTEQKQRFSDLNKHKSALDLLDYCEKEGYISKIERKGKITTLERFIRKPEFQEHMGFEIQSDGTIRRNRVENEFIKGLKEFINDLVIRKKVHSRMNKKEIVNYSRELSSKLMLSSKRIKPVKLSINKNADKSQSKKPYLKLNIINIESNNKLLKTLKEVSNDKLISLYGSLVDINLKEHTPILTIGTWAFFETLTALTGRKENVDFFSYISGEVFQNLKIARNDKKAIKSALKRIQDNGNVSKHHKIATNYNGEQLNNDFKSLNEITIHLLKNALKESRKK